MASITAIELGADTCALARTSVWRGEVRVLAIEMLYPAAFPGAESFSVAVRQARRTLKLPRRARVVVWGLPEGSNRNDAAVKPLLAPLTAAGFSIERVVSPCNALAALARVRAPRSGENATCWLAINRGGVAIVVVRPGKQIYAHSFVWDSTLYASGSQARLLQRYSLVSALSPEVKRAMAEARKHGTPVDAVVTCGNLPDLRSLTMPLIEDLDVEVETLDSLDGLVVKPPVAERIAEAAPAIRLACAGVIARGTRPRDESKRRAAHRAGALFRAAAVAAGLAAMGFAWYQYRVVKPPQLARNGARQTPPPATTPAPKATPAPKTTPATKTTPAPKTTPTAVVTPPPPVTTPATTPVVTTRPPVSVPTTPRRQQPEDGPRGSRLALPPLTSKPAVAPPTPPARQQPQNAPGPSPLAPRGSEARPVSAPPARIPTAPPPAPAGVMPPAAPTDKPQARTPEPKVSARPPTAQMPTLLKEPIPRLTAILVANDRRFATVNDGQIIGIGDVVGGRIVIAIDDKAVVLREPSGVQIRVGLGGRVLSIERGRN